MRRSFLVGMLFLLFVVGIFSFKYWQLGFDYLLARGDVAAIVNSKKILQGGDLRDYGVRFFYKGDERVLRAKRLYVVYGCGEEFLSESMMNDCQGGRSQKGELLFGHEYLSIGDGVYMVWGSFDTGFFGVY